MEHLNNTHYKFGQVKGIFGVRQEQHVMIELVQIDEVHQKERLSKKLKTKIKQYII